MGAKKKQHKNKLFTKGGGIISDKVGNYANDPFFIKSAEEAKLKQNSTESVATDR